MTSPHVAAYGTWSSPISSADVASASGSMSELVGDDAGLWWLETSPTRDGRAAVMCWDDEGIHQITDDQVAVRSRVNEYGGGTLDARDGHLVFCDDIHSCLMVRAVDGRMTQVTESDPQVKYADLQIHPGHGVVLAVREDRQHQPPLTSLVAIDLTSHQVHTLVAGADFYANPALSRDGRLAWLEWNQPAMPWHSTVLKVARLTDGVLSDPVTVAGLPDSGRHGVAVHHPRWVERGGEPHLLFTCDASGYYTLMEYSDGPARPVASTSADIDKPLFLLGNRSFAQLGDGRILGQIIEEGQHFLQITGWDGEIHKLGGVADVESITASRGVGHVLIRRPNRPAEISRLESDGSLTTLRRVGQDPDPAVTSLARSIMFTGRFGPVQMWYYPPTNDGWIAPEGTRPPALVRVHGGPTHMSTNALEITTQFWTSRGFAVVDVNYSGSVGFGSAWRDRLNGLWGVADVADCADAAEALVDAGLCDPGRIVISGGSAGGFTVLRCLMDTEVFAAGISRYGVTDLLGLVGGHKFEARYLDSLVGPLPAARTQYERRSPINTLDQLHRPVLVLQGSDDPIVPLDQATRLAEAADARGLPVALVVLDAEGHGFRSPQAQVTALEAEFSFCTQVLGIEAPQAVPLEVRNLR